MVDPSHTVALHLLRFMVEEEEEEVEGRVVLMGTRLFSRLLADLILAGVVVVVVVVELEMGMLGIEELVM